MNTTIVLTPEQYENYQIFLTLVAQGCFDIQYGKVTLSFADGTLQNVIKETMVYRKLAAKKT